LVGYHYRKLAWKHGVLPYEVEYEPSGAEALLKKVNMRK